MHYSTSNLHQMRYPTCLVFLFGLMSFGLSAQPGFDYGRITEYKFAIVDEDGELISFRGNDEYQIRVNGHLYDPEHIPNEEVEDTDRTYRSVFRSHVQVNDFSKVVEFEQVKFPGDVEIIIHHDDERMILIQPISVSYSFPKQTQLPEGASLELEFIPGFYYFPEWFEAMVAQMPTFNDGTTLSNFSQAFFSLDESVYENLTPQNVNFLPNGEFPDHILYSRFLDGTYLNWEIDELDVESMEPYTIYQWETKLYPTSDSTRFFGLMDARWHDRNCTSFKSFFGVLDIANNEIDYWAPSRNARLHAIDQFHVDTEHGMLCASVWERELAPSNLNDCELVSSDLKKAVYSSSDEGRTWERDVHRTAVFREFRIRSFELLDDRHWLCYKRVDVPHPRGGTRVRGVYYLMRDAEIIDSLLTPKGLHYNDNYNRYSFELRGDTAFLGRWETPTTNNEDLNAQPILMREGETWRFELYSTDEYPYLDQNYNSPYQRTTETLGNRITLPAFSGGFYNNLEGPYSGSEFIQGYHILQRGDVAYILGFSRTALFVYQSVDAGDTWNFYPIPIHDSSNRYEDFNVPDEYSLNNLFLFRLNDEGELVFYVDGEQVVVTLGIERVTGDE